MGDTTYSRLPSELTDLSGVLDIYFGNITPANLIYNETEIYSNTSSYNGGTYYAKKFTTSAIDLTGLLWLKAKIDIRETSGGTGRAYVNLYGTGTETTSAKEPRSFELTGNYYNNVIVENNTSYQTHTFYIYVGDLTGSQQFDIYIRSADCDITNFYLYSQFRGVIV